MQDANDVNLIGDANSQGTYVSKSFVCQKEELGPLGSHACCVLLGSANARGA